MSHLSKESKEFHQELFDFHEKRGSVGILGIKIPNLGRKEMDLRIFYI
jgi:hypothetical protein